MTLKILHFTVTDQTAGALGFERPSFQFSISEDPVQKDTILLNYCIDDIERFAAEIRRKHFPEEINDRRKSSEPRAIDFVNIFQKFKLAFNLLVRLPLVFKKFNFYGYFSLRVVWKSLWRIPMHLKCFIICFHLWPF